MIIVFFWIAFSIFAAILAARFKRSAFGYLLLSIVISPLLCLLLLVILGPVKAEAALPVAAEALIKCPDCAEDIKPDAKVCKHCGYRLQLEAPAPTASE